MILMTNVGGNSNMFCEFSRGEMESNWTCAYFFKRVGEQPPTIDEYSPDAPS